MRILYIHNDYARPSGEEHAAEAIAALLTEHGHQVEFFRRHSSELHGVTGQIKGFLAGIHNPAAARRLAARLDDYRPDLVQVQNLYPLLSPAIFRPLRERRLPIVMRCPNYRLFCPNGLCYNSRQNRVCEECLGGHEWHCAWNRCAHDSALRSLGYALRGWHARHSRLILDNVDVFIVQTEFQKAKFMAQGIPAEQLGVVPGILPDIVAPGEWSPGDKVVFVGRVSLEKGIMPFLACARQLPDVPFVIAGAYDGMERLKQQSPPNVEWRGFLKGEALRQVYLEARVVTIPSQWYEGFPNVIVMGMLLGRPVLTSTIGATGTIVADRQSGRLCDPGDTAAMSAIIAELYHDVDQCRRLGLAGQKQARELYSRETIYHQLMAIYQHAHDRHNPN